MGNFVNKFILAPYYWTLRLRNALYDKGIFKSRSFDIPTICIGNVTVGGTGKTPHTEMFIREYLKSGMRVAVVSRGYGRKSSGYKEVNVDDKVTMVGDEPLQIKRKFPQVQVIVDANRCRALDILRNQEVRPDVVLLDDAFQHRKIKPTYSVLLIDYSLPIFKDSLLPIGRLRDTPEQIKRADAVIITKIPSRLERWDKEVLKTINKVSPQQRIYFSTIEYKDITAVFKDVANNRYIYSSEAILLTGIANSTPMRRYLSSIYKTIYAIEYRDHHNYSDNDMKLILKKIYEHPNAVIITTEKDMQRIIDVKYIDKSTKERLFYLPIESRILDEENKELFDYNLNK